MHKTLRTLYYNLTELDQRFLSDGAYLELIDRVIKEEKTLKDALGEAEQNILHRLSNLYGDLGELMERENFAEGFRLGAKIMVEVLGED